MLDSSFKDNLIKLVNGEAFFNMNAVDRQKTVKNEVFRDETLI